MITRVSSVGVQAGDQDQAVEFYVEKLGFDRVGLAPRYLHIDGAWRDHLLFAITAEQVLPGGLIARADAAGVDR